MDWIVGGLALLATVTVRHYALSSPRARRMTRGAEVAYFAFWAFATALAMFIGGVLHWFDSVWLFFVVGALTLSLARLYLLKRTARLGPRRGAAVYAAFWPVSVGVVLSAMGYLDSPSSAALALGVLALVFLGTYALAEFFFRAFSGELDDPRRPGPRV